MLYYVWAVCQRQGEDGPVTMSGFIEAKDEDEAVEKIIEGDPPEVNEDGERYDDDYDNGYRIEEVIASGSCTVAEFQQEK